MMYKNIVVATGSQTSIPLLKMLIELKILDKVIIPFQYDMLVPILKEIISEDKIKINKQPDKLDIDKTCDLVILLGYPETVNLIPGVRIVNVHYGKLPENRGANPVFHDLKNGKKMTYVTTHEVTEKLDSGDILTENSFEIIEGENNGMLHARLSNLSLPLIKEIIDGKANPEPQDESKAIYYSRPNQNDITIHWHSMNAQEIERLVNACNPQFGGAKTSIQGSLLNIWEVSVANVQLDPNQTPLPPGTIIHSSPQEGIFVICKDQTFIRMNIISTVDGFFSGNKLAGLGTQPGVMLG